MQVIIELPVQAHARISTNHHPRGGSGNCLFAAEQITQSGCELAVAQWPIESSWVADAAGNYRFGTKSYERALMNLAQIQAASRRILTASMPAPSSLLQTASTQGLVENSTGSNRRTLQSAIAVY